MNGQTPSGRGRDHARVYRWQSSVLQITKGRSKLSKKATLKQNGRQGCRPPKTREVLSETLVLSDILVKVEASWRRERQREPPAEILSAAPPGAQPKDLSDVFVKTFQVVPYCDHKLVGVGAVDNAVIVAQHQADDMTHRDGVVPILICDDNRFFEDAAHA